MEALRRFTRTWSVPLAVAAGLVAVLVVSPALGGPSFVSGKKVVKTITKKTNARQIVSPDPKAVPPGGEQILLTLDLPQGNYLVRSTFSVDRIVGGVVTCRLRIVGVAEDTSTSFADNPAAADEEESVAMETAGRVSNATQAQLICTSALAGTSIRYAEITALKVPKLTVTRG
jgi:hypothetical protein